MTALDIFVHAGDPEPFGLVNVEAMAMGLPVVAFAHGALPEIVEEGVTGRLLPPGDEDAMARAITELLDDPVVRSRMGSAGQARALRHFSIERTVAEIDAVLQGFLDKQA